MSPLKATGEAAFQQQILQLAAYYGWRAYHTHDSRRSQAGFPDLVLVRGPELIFAELKTEKGRASGAQQDWIRALMEVSSGVLGARKIVTQAAQSAAYEITETLPAVDVYLWRPSDFDAINTRLARAQHRVEPLYRPPGAPAIPGQITIDEQIASTG